MICPVCHEHAERTFQAEEVQLGTGDLFIYGECSRCGALWLLNPPNDLARYYPREYESFSHTAEPPSFRRKAIVRAKLLGVPIHQLRREPVLDWPQLLHLVGARRDTSILDVGAGAGDFTRTLQSHGFTDATAIDPYSESVERAEIETYHPDRQYELIFFNDVFEHIRAPQAVLTASRRLLTPHGQIVIRTPVADSWAWRHYGTSWYGLDPPRHLFIPTTKAMESLARTTGLLVTREIRDSGLMQFIGSEAYAQGFAFDEILRLPRPAKARLRAWKRQAMKLNSDGQGDHATFVLSSRAHDQKK